MGGWDEVGLGVWRWEVSWLSYTLTPKQWSVIAGDSDAHLKLLESPSCFDLDPKCLLGPVWSPKDLVPWGEAQTRGLSHL